VALPTDQTWRLAQKDLIVMMRAVGRVCKPVMIELCRSYLDQAMLNSQDSADNLSATCWAIVQSIADCLIVVDAESLCAFTRHGFALEIVFSQPGELRGDSAEILAVKSRGFLAGAPR
jgi:hypothetical protein